MLAQIFQNNSDIVFALRGLNDSLTSRHVYFLLALSSYVFTLLVNLTLVLTVCLDQALHQPIYILLCNLCLNGLCGASCFYPKLLHDLLADGHVISYAGCLLQVFGIYTYVFCEFTSLTVMAYDRYLAICRPLHYGGQMTPQRVAQLLVLSWIFSILEAGVGVTLTATLPICARHLPKIFCTNWEVVKLSCSDPTRTINNFYGFALTASHMGQTGLILISYVHLVRASIRSRADRRKFVQTCLPHLLTLLVFSASLLFDIMYSRYGNSSNTMEVVRNMLAAEFLVVPPLLNPVIYGMNLQQLRSRVLQRLSLRLQGPK